MPGVNLLVKKNQNKPEFTSPNAEVIFQNDLISISKNIPYPHYPVQTWQNEQFVYIMEGYFYEWIDYKSKIEDFAKSCFSKTNKDSLLKNYFSDTDAEFVIILHNKIQKSTIVFNDILARFPLYCSESNDNFFLSRNVSFIEYFNGLTSNPQAFLETLTLGFSLGTKTLYKNIERVPAGTIIEISGNAIEKRQYHTFNYEGLISDRFDAGQVLEETRSIFVEAVKNRSRFGDLNVVALSGGLDSRAVAGAFRLSGLPYELISFSDKEGYAQKDILLAKRIAEKQNLPFKLVELPDPDIHDFELIFRLKYGLNALDMSYLVSFYKYVTALSKCPAIFTGDGGDKIFPSQKPRVFIKSPQSIVKHAIYSNLKMVPENAARILGTDKNNVSREILKQMHSYPECDWDQKYIHFLMENRVSNWLVEGEDRNRCFLPSFTPFYHVRIFKKLMSVRAHFKKDFRLYAGFLKIISPETYDIPNANWGFPISQRNKIRWIYSKLKFKNTMPGMRIKSLLEKKNNYTLRLTPFENEMFSKLISLPSVQQKFDLDFIRNMKHFDSDNFLHVLTLMKIVSLEDSHEAHW